MKGLRVARSGAKTEEKLFIGRKEMNKEKDQRGLGPHRAKGLRTGVESRRWERRRKEEEGLRPGEKAARWMYVCVRARGGGGEDGGREGKDRLSLKQEQGPSGGTRRWTETAKGVLGGVRYPPEQGRGEEGRENSGASPTGPARESEETDQDREGEHDYTPSPGRGWGRCLGSGENAGSLGEGQEPSSTPSVGRRERGRLRAQAGHSFKWGRGS